MITIVIVMYIENTNPIFKYLVSFLCILEPTQVPTLIRLDNYTYSCILIT